MSMPPLLTIMEEQHYRRQQKEAILQWLSGCFKRRLMSMPPLLTIMGEQHYRRRQKEAILP
jgi:hypothetical protein